MNQRFKITTYIPPDGDDRVAEVCFDNNQFAEVRQENGKFVVDFSARVKEASQVFDVNELNEAIEAAIKKLSGPDKIAQLVEKKLKEK